MIEGFLTPEDEGWAHHVAMQRHAEDTFRGFDDRHGGWNKAHGEKLHLQGARAELFAARAIGTAWTPRGFDDRAQPDVGDFDVRSTTYRTGGLLLHPEDPDGRRAVLVVVSQDRFVIPGWIWGADGKQEQFWWTGGKSPCYRVPQSALYPLPDRVVA